MAETNSLLNCRIQQWVPGVRIPPSPRKKEDDGCIVFFFGVWRSPASAPALGAGGRRFESFCPDGENQEVTSNRNLLFFGNERNLHSICTQTFSNGYNFKYGSFVKLPIELNKKAAPFEAANAKLDNPRKMGAFVKRDKSTYFPAITNRILLRCALLPFLSPLLN